MESKRDVIGVRQESNRNIKRVSFESNRSLIRVCVRAERAARARGPAEGSGGTGPWGEEDTDPVDRSCV